MDMVVRPPLSGSTGPVGSEFDLPALPGGPEAIPGVIRFLRFTVDDLSKADLSVDAPETRAGGLDDKLEVCLFHLEQLFKATSNMIDSVSIARNWCVLMGASQLEEIRFALSSELDRLIEDQVARGIMVGRHSFYQEEESDIRILFESHLRNAFESIVIAACTCVVSTYPRASRPSNHCQWGVFDFHQMLEVSDHEWTRVERFFHNEPASDGERSRSSHPHIIDVGSEFSSDEA